MTREVYIFLLCLLDSTGNFIFLWTDWILATCPYQITKVSQFCSIWKLFSMQMIMFVRAYNVQSGDVVELLLKTISLSRAFKLRDYERTGNSLYLVLLMDALTQLPNCLTMQSAHTILSHKLTSATVYTF